MHPRLGTILRIDSFCDIQEMERSNSKNWLLWSMNTVSTDFYFCVVLLYVPCVSGLYIHDCPFVGFLLPFMSVSQYYIKDTAQQIYESWHFLKSTSALNTNQYLFLYNKIGVVELGITYPTQTGHTDCQTNRKCHHQNHLSVQGIPINRIEIQIYL